VVLEDSTERFLSFGLLVSAVRFVILALSAFVCLGKGNFFCPEETSGILWAAGGEFGSSSTVIASLGAVLVLVLVLVKAVVVVVAATMVDGLPCNETCKDPLKLAKDKRTPWPLFLNDTSDAMSDGFNVNSTPPIDNVNAAGDIPGGKFVGGAGGAISVGMV
jgi:hypothetical protein